MLEIKTDAAKVASDLQGMASQVPFATALSLTRVAQLAQADEVKEMQDVFNNPTPYTLGGVGFSGANRSNLSSRVFLKTAIATAKGKAAGEYLIPEISGGERPLKKFEAALRNANVLPEGMFAVPGSGATIDAYGNMSRSEITQILSYFRAFPEAGYAANTTSQRKLQLRRGTKRRLGFAYFVGAPADGKLPLGVWKRTGLHGGTAIKPMLIFVDHVHYQAIYNFDYTSRLSVQRNWDEQFARAWSETKRTAR